MTTRYVINWYTKAAYSWYTKNSTRFADDISLRYIRALWGFRNTIILIT